ncbi:MAG: hypothetical protein H0V91_03250 [Flavisolibacter sp.]|jgi:hypothetical protein|nr:hypothetical protein [Flavisolibacter sp.]
MAAVLSGLLIVSAVSMKNLVDYKRLPFHLPVILSSTTFPHPALPEGSVPDHPINRHIQNALVTELVGAERKDDHKRKVIDNLKKQVTITGKKDGFKNFYLTIENKSFILLKNVRVQVDYLNSVGRLINSQIITIQDIPARSEKSWKMVDAKTGVKVQYKILDIFSNKQKIAFHEA